VAGNKYKHRDGQREREREREWKERWGPFCIYLKLMGTGEKELFGKAQTSHCFGLS
jgi:hypothetical protein